MRWLYIPLLAAPFALNASFAAAQNAPLANPSSDQIINGLLPSPTAAQTTRGIHPVEPPNLPPPNNGAAGKAAAAMQAAAGMSAMSGTTQPPAARSVDITVNFATGSAALTPDAMHTLDAIGKALSDDRLGQYHFDIEGHTDTVGAKDYNKTLSMHRAEAVVTYIETKYGIAANRLQAVGKGSDDLLVATPDQTPEPRNRRVRLVAVGA